MKTSRQALWTAASAGPPLALKQGDTVGVVAPASMVHYEKLQRGVRLLENRGFRVQVGRHVFGTDYLFSGNDDERATDLLTMLHASHIRAIFCARGGYGSQRLLPRLADHVPTLQPKIVVGYSDITALHALLGRAGWVTFHGPMPGDWAHMADGGQSVASLFSLIMGETMDWLPLPGGTRLDVWHPGKATGRLVGGNLSLMTALLGTPYCVNTRGAILFVEDVGEAPYRIDRMLSTLQLAGKLSDVAGVVLGDFTNCDPPPGGPAVTVDNVLQAHFGPLGVPILKGYPAGHGNFNFALPLGSTVQLDTSRPGIRLVSRAVV